MPVRANCVLFWWWLISWIVVCWGAAPTKPSPPHQFPTLAVRVVIIMALVLVVGRVSIRAWRELITGAPQYAHQWEERYQYFRVLSKQPGSRAVVAPLKGINSRNVLLQGIDYKLDTTHPYNAQAAKWFGLAEISRSDAK